MINRKQRKQLEAENKKWPTRFVRIPRDQWPSDRDETRIEVYRSRDYLAQIFREPPGLRISLNRTSMLPCGRWDDGLSWDELQKVKSDLGYGDYWAVEVYPPDRSVVNVANMRHLWVLSGPPEFGWKRT